ncbi:pentatricopeptide repeat-containing family protein [Salix suchowensis]|nr:pentatricopeptide repeat-containing family protein [Salix suchowensis]
MNGWLKKPILDTSGVAVKRWKWGLELETQLDKLQFVPYMTHLAQALKTINETDAVVSLFKWAKRQTWYVYFDGIQSLFDVMFRDSSKVATSLIASSRVLKYLAKAEKLEVLFCCIKKAQDSGSKIGTETDNILTKLFLNKGLTYKAFEIYESMELMITSLEKSGHLDAAFNRSVFSLLVDSMGKAGRLETSMKVYMEMQVLGLKTSVIIMHVSLIELEIESHVKSGKLDILYNSMTNAGLSTYTALLTLSAHKKLVYVFFRDYELEKGDAKYFMNVLINYLFLTGRKNRAIIFYQRIAWFLDARNLSIGAALVAAVHALHRFRKHLLYYGVIPRQIKLVTVPTLRIVVALMLSSVESLLKLARHTNAQAKHTFPTSAPEIRSLTTPKSLISANAV